MTTKNPSVGSARREQKKRHERALAEAARSPSAFRNLLRLEDIESYGQSLEPWQQLDFDNLDPGWQRAIGRKADGGFSRGWLERPRGHSKSTDIAVMATWAIAFSQRYVLGIAAAGDRDQAAILRDAIKKLANSNPWLNDWIEVNRFEVTNKVTDSKLSIISSDAATAYGLTPDFIICDEVSHWRNDSMWQALYSAAVKRPNCCVLVITNAGFEGEWACDMSKRAEGDEAWYFNHLEGPQASWITADALAEQKRMLPNEAYKRLWLNEWVAGGGDALTRDDIAAAFTKKTGPLTRHTEGWQFFGGLDLGIKRDNAAFVVLAARSHDPHIHLAHLRLFRPADYSCGKVDLTEIETHLVDIRQRYRLKHVRFDPWQAEHMAQRLENLADASDRVARRTNPMGKENNSAFMIETPPVAANLREQAQLTIETFRDRRIRSHDCPELRNDLLKLRVEEKSYGYRLTSPRDATGHGDSFSAFALALQSAYAASGKRRGVRVF